MDKGEFVKRLEVHLAPFPPRIPDGWCQAVPYAILHPTTGVRVVAAVKAYDLPRHCVIRLADRMHDTYVDPDGQEQRAEDPTKKLEDPPYFEDFDKAVEVAEAWIADRVSTTW